MKKSQVSNRNFGIEIEFQRDGSNQEILSLLDSNGIKVRETGYEPTTGQTEKWTLKPDGSLACARYGAGFSNPSRTGRIGSGQENGPYS